MKEAVIPILIDAMVSRLSRESDRVVHDVSHMLKVWAFAKQIAEMEGLDREERLIAEASAVIHDISCPYCRKKYGNADGSRQEMESQWIAEEFLRPFDIPQDEKERIIYNACHHHTYSGDRLIDLQILLEADFLVNADQGRHDKASIIAFRGNVFRTESGKKLLDEIYGLSPIA
ncbi:MAG: HD domain-containing protein [Candidatus Ornithospirochaeta sp.]|nr:HD domain-containing protein [Candidatus Ornithospirochaeta sp.]